MIGIPSEVAIGGVYFPPLLFVFVLAIVLALITGQLLNRYRLSRFFFYPPLVFVALIVIYSGLLGYTGLLSPWYVS